MLIPLLSMLSRPATLLSGGVIGLILIVLWIGRTMHVNIAWLIVICLLLVVIWMLVVFLMKMSSQKQAQTLEKSIDDQAQAQIQSSKPGKEQELEQVRQQLLQAIESLKKSKVGKGKGGEGALYVLPWYMIIGPPGSGKTTLLLNGGLSFPYLDPAREKASVKGVGGTRNCDWWFAEEAVLLDTAGRYVLPVEADDTKEWLGFLELLRKNRGKKPINGLIVCVAVSDLLGGGEEVAEQHAQKIRTRVDELIKNLGISFPIYVLFTKCDLVRGFVEFFGDFSKLERAHVWGATFGRERAVSEPAARLFESEFDQLTIAVDEVKIPRLAQLGKPEGRPEVLFFPLQVAALRARLARFLEVLFKPNPYQELPVFRGFYLTSGTQEGRPIDQVINAMLSGFGVSTGMDAMYVEPSQTKSYFIEDVFGKIAFPDRHMAGPSVAGERKKRSLRARFFATGVVLLAILSVILFVLSAANESLVRRSRTLSEKALSSVEGGRQRLPLGDLQTLDELRGTLERMEARGKPGPSFAFLGTYQGRKAERQARMAYLVVLEQKALRPALPWLENKLQQGGGSGFKEYFDWYRTWRVLHDPAARLKLEDADGGALVLADYWNGETREDESQYRVLLERQLSYASRFPDEMVGVYRRRNPDGEIDREARERIRSYWSADRLYASLLASGSGIDEVTLLNTAGGEPAISGTQAVPGVFTKTGWETSARPYLEWVETVRDHWAMQEAWSGAPSQRAPLRVRYEQDYESRWLNFLSTTSVRASAQTGETKAFLEKASTEDSPILKLLRRVDDETYYTERDELADIGDHFSAVHWFVGDHASLTKKLTGGGFLSGCGGKKKKEDSKAGVKSKAPADEYLALVKTLSASLSDIKDSGDPKNAPQVLDLAGWIQTRIPTDERAGQELASLLELPSQVITGSMKKAQGKGLQSQWSTVFQEFETNLAGKYPFEASDDDAALPDFVSFFSPEGSFWSYYESSLKGLISENGEQILDDSQTLSPEFRNCLRQAFRIKKALFSDGDKAGFTLSLRTSQPQAEDAASGLLPVVTRLEIGGGALIYDMGQRQWKSLQWPGDEPEAGASLSMNLKAGTAKPIERPGFWGFFRMLDQSKLFDAGGGSVSMIWKMDTDHGPVQIAYEARGLAANHPLRRELLRFRCPAQVFAGP